MHVTEITLSDYFKLISTFLKFDFKRLRPKVFTSRNYKRFHEYVLLTDLYKLKLDEENSESSY